LLFLRQATNRYYAALDAIGADRKAGKMAHRDQVAADFARRRALMLPPSARYAEILKTPKDGNLGAAITAAMEEIERAYPPLAGQAPRCGASTSGGRPNETVSTRDSS
jgi:type I restriction enzyme M protein